MGKRDLVGGSLWEQYSDKVSGRMNNPEHHGEFSEEEAKQRGAKLIVADHGADSCGDAVRIYWLVDPKTNRIIDSKFKSFGCGTAIASSDAIAEMCRGLTVDEAVKITNIDVEEYLRDEPETPAVPPQKMHCSVMAYDVIKKAAALYNNVDLDSYEEEDMVCECARVTLGTIEDTIRINSLTTVEEIANFTKAGAFCKSCIRPGGHEQRKYYLEEILERTKARESVAGAPAQTSPEDFASMNLIQKHKAVEGVLDSVVRPALAADGGSCEVVDMQLDNERTRIYIRYGGACAGCGSSGTGTLLGIQEALRGELDSSIDVIPL